MESLMQTLVQLPGKRHETDKETVRGNQGLVFDVQGHSVHDGPGTRTTVFLCGCPLSCRWCSNPEGWYTRPVIRWSSAKCKRCGACISACPDKAITIDRDGRTLIHDRTKCNRCTSLACMDACLHEGLLISARYYTADELMQIFRRDRQFWGTRGGVTFSGGEPLFQREFIYNVLKKCKEAYMHTAVETTACVETGFFFKVIEFIDWVFCDIKHMDTRKHAEYCGVGNELILKNIRMLAEKPDWDGFMINRMPVIPGFNDDEENIRQTAGFIRKCGLEAINILPFHRLGESKYRQLDMDYPFSGQKSPEEKEMQAIKTWFEEEGIICFIGYETPF